MKHFKYKRCFCLFKEMLKISISIRNPVVWQGESNPAPAAVKTPRLQWEKGKTQERSQSLQGVYK